MNIKPIRNPVIKHTKLFINNEFVDSQDGKRFAAINPATCKEIVQVQEAGTRDVDLAVDSAKAAFKRDSPWRQLDARKRGDLLFKLASLLERDVEYLASLETLNCGKPFRDSVSDVLGSAKTLRFYGGACDKINGDLLPSDGDNLTYTLLEPIGVCGAITPWNYPLEMATVKLAPCLAMGNTLVLKPAEQSPLTALALAALVKEAEFPPGVFNVIPGFGPTVGLPLVQHPDVRKISFTGSTEVGKLIQSEASKHVKRVTLEMGGKSPLIVLSDADLDDVVRCAHDNVLVNQGQCCIAASRTFVHESIYEEFVRRSVELAKKRSIGDPLELDVDQGPQIDKQQFEHILALIASGVEQGAKLECGGKQFGSSGWFIEPTIFSNVTDEMRIAKEEIFGPVQSILKFKDIDEVIERANATPYGLGAGVFSRDIQKALYVGSRLDAGQVFVNTYMDSSVQTPFGGFKESGIGREYGMENLREYAEVKCMIVKLGFKMI